jgi:hypothetical protein
LRLSPAASVEAVASELRGTEAYLRLPGSSSALSVFADQWEQQVLGVVSEAGCIRDVFVCQHPNFQLSEGPNFET